MNDARLMRDIEGFSNNTALFTTIKALGIWTDVDDSELQIIAEEYYMHSSCKRLSPLMRKWVYDAVDLSALITKVSHALFTRYGKNWSDIWKAYFDTSYKPLENYSMTEDGTSNVNTDLTNVSKGKVYGFNSETPVGDTETEVTTTGDGQKNVTATKLTRSGNIGITTQQMLQSELDLRVYDYWQGVFADIDRLLCFMIISC